MVIVFKTKKLKKIFNDLKLLKKHFGVENAKIIMNRMMFLKAVASLNEVPAEKPTRLHLLEGNYKGCYSIDLKHPFRLIIKPVNEPLQYLEDGGIDLKMVTDIMIIKMEDYH